MAAFQRGLAPFPSPAVTVLVSWGSSDTLPQVWCLSTTDISSLTSSKSVSISRCRRLCSPQSLWGGAPCLFQLLLVAGVSGLQDITPASAMWPCHPLLLCLCQISSRLPLTGTLEMIFGAHLGSPGQSSHLMTPNFITPGKSPFHVTCTFRGLRPDTSRGQYSTYDTIRTSLSCEMGRSVSYRHRRAV